MAIKATHSITRAFLTEPNVKQPDRIARGPGAIDTPARTDLSDRVYARARARGSNARDLFSHFADIIVAPRRRGRGRSPIYRCRLRASSCRWSLFSRRRPRVRVASPRDSQIPETVFYPDNDAETVLLVTYETVPGLQCPPRGATRWRERERKRAIKKPAGRRFERSIRK